MLFNGQDLLSDMGKILFISFYETYEIKVVCFAIYFILFLKLLIIPFLSTLLMCESIFYFDF
jgi:hypothetical protein